MFLQRINTSHFGHITRYQISISSKSGHSMFVLSTSLWSVLTTNRKSYTSFSKNPFLDS